jgi:hypothetical protein
MINPTRTDYARTSPTMGAAMDTALTTDPTSGDGAAQVLDAGGDYLAGATGMLDRIGDGIQRRVDALGKLDATDPAAAAKQREQIDLLQRLQERVRTSIERIGDILAGRDRRDVGSDAGGIDITDLGSRADTDRESVKRTREEDLALLEQRRQLLTRSSF